MEDITYHIVDPDRTYIIERIDDGILVSCFDRYKTSDEVFLKRTAFELFEDDPKKIRDMLYFLLDAMGIHEGIDIKLNKEVAK